MARRADPERIFTARRTAVRNTLASEAMSVESAEPWCDAWQDEGERLGLDRMWSEYWTIGSAWVHEQRKTRRLP